MGSSSEHGPDGEDLAQRLRATELRLREAGERIREQDIEIENLARERRRLVAQILDAEELTRRRIAQALHDDALQSLLAAHQDLIEAAPGRSGVERVQEVVGSAIARVREAVVALHPVTLERGGLEQALGAVAGEAERRGGFRCQVRVEPGAVGQQDHLVLAVARELLANAAVHSGASLVTVSVAPDEGPDGSAVVLEVVDDGGGIGAGRPVVALREGHVGLASIAQRLEAIGGSFEIGDAQADGSGRGRAGAGPGTRARAVVPLTPRGPA